MLKVVLVNLSDKVYGESRQRLNRSALDNGVDLVCSYDFDEIINTSFYKENINILSQPKGVGYWLWKPYIILEAFKEIDEGDVVIYSDCGILIIDSLSPLIEICRNETDVLLFSNSNYTNRIWTKRDCFVFMDCDEAKYWDGQHCDAAFSLFRKTQRSTEILQEWLKCGTNELIITDSENMSGKANFPEFIEHRWDQSILSLLAIKHNIELYRMPTQFGNHYKMSGYRVPGEVNCVNQGDRRQLDYYSSDPFENSPYNQLLDHHRRKFVKRQGLEKIEFAIRRITKGLWA